MAMESESLPTKENVINERSECLLNNNGKNGRNSWCSNLYDIGVIGLIDCEDGNNCTSTPGTDQSPLGSPLKTTEAKRCRSPNSSFIQDFKRVKRRSDGATKLSRNNFEMLSDEIIVGIFSLVPKHVLATLSLVCKRFRCLCLDESLWTRFDLSFKTLPSFTLGYVLGRGVRALRLNSSAVTSPVFDPLQPFKGSSFRVEYLDLSAVHISSQDLERVLTLCRSLKKLSIEACEVSDKVCRNIACNSRLDTLDMAMCTNLSCTGLLDIASNCKSLESVNISWCNLSAEALLGFCREVSHSLVSLNLAGALRSLSNEDVDRLVQRCPDLTELDISDCTKITGQVIESLVDKLDNLQKLGISRSYKISASNVLLLKGNASLCMLNMFGNSQGSMFSSDVMKFIKNAMPGVAINSEMMSPVARPTVGIRRTSIWEIRCRD